jgi:environmental stress-induced protein Ves
MPVVRFKLEQLVSTNWKNGGGRTREIVRVPAGAGMDKFEWRASVAEIAADGPFSTFPGYDRVLVLLSGDGVHLRSADGTIDHRLNEPMHPFAFAGEKEIHASLLGGTSTDFNIMTRRETTSADVRIVDADQTLASCSAGVLFSARGKWTARAIEHESRVSLDTHEGLWWDGEPLSWELTAPVSPGVLISVRLLWRQPR